MVRPSENFYSLCSAEACTLWPIYVNDNDLLVGLHGLSWYLSPHAYHFFCFDTTIYVIHSLRLAYWIDSLYIGLCWKQWRHQCILHWCNESSDILRWLRWRLFPKSARDNCWNGPTTWKATEIVGSCCKMDFYRTTSSTTLIFLHVCLQYKFDLQPSRT